MTEKSKPHRRMKQLEKEIRQKYLHDQSPIMVEADLGFLRGGQDPKGVDDYFKARERQK